MAVIPANIVRCSVRYESGAEICVNTIHIRVSGIVLDWGVATQSVADKVRDVFQANWNNLRGLHHDQARITRVDAYHLSDVTGKTIDKRTAVFSGFDNTGAAEDMAPFELAAVVSLYGYDPALYDPEGARKRGRIYLGFLGKNTINDVGRFGDYNNTCDMYRTVMSSLFDYQIDVANLLSIRPVILSRRWNSAADIRTVLCDNLFDVQRRRQNALVPVEQSFLVPS